MFGPIINDITTTFPNPPTFVAIAKTQKDRNYTYIDANYKKQLEGYPNLRALVCPFEKIKCFQLVLDVANGFSDWKIVDASEVEARLEATATTPILRFKDDIVIEVRALDANHAIHMRSKSRLGKGDLGANAKRIKTFFEKLTAKFGSE